MEVGLKKESPITYSNGKRLFTIDQKVDALVRIKMTGCSKAEVARSLHVAESTFRGWFKNKDIVMKAEVKYNEIKCKSSSVSSLDGYKSDGDNSCTKSVSADGSTAAEECNNSSSYTAEENSRSRFSSPDPVVATMQQQQQQPPATATAAAAAPARRSPERVRTQHHHKQKLKKLPSNGGAQQQHNSSININNNNNISNNNNNNLHVGALAAAAAAAAAAGINGFGGMNGGLAGGMNGGLTGGLASGMNGGLISGMNGSLTGALNGGLAGGMNGGLLGANNCTGFTAQQLHHQIAQLTQHPLHQNLSSLGGLKGSNAAAAFAAAAAMAAAAAANDPANIKLSPTELHNKINSYFNPSPLQLATSLPGPINFLPPNFTTAENSYIKPSNSFINTMVTATLMEPQALDLSTHSRNKFKNSELATNPPITTASTTTPQNGQKILRHNSYRKLFKPYKSRCTDDVVHTRQGINPRNPLWPLQ